MKISVDDGCASDVRFALLADQYNVDAIFYWPIEWRSLAYEKGYEPLNYLEALDIARDYEIGAHTITHRHLTKLSTNEAHKEIYEPKLMLEALFDTDVTKFCPPRGYTNDELTDYTLGIYESQRLTKGYNLVHIHPDSGANGNIPWQDRYEDIKDVKDLELWCHSWELDKYNLWEELEEFLRENISS